MSLLCSSGVVKWSSEANRCAWIASQATNDVITKLVIGSCEAIRLKKVKKVRNFIFQRKMFYLCGKFNDLMEESNILIQNKLVMENRRNFIKKSVVGAVGLTWGGALRGYSATGSGWLAGVRSRDNKKYKYVKGENIYPTTPYGPLSAGLSTGGTAFIPADGTGESVIFTRIWNEAYMFPGFEMNRLPVSISKGLGGCRDLTAVDWNHDGIQDFVVSERTGFLFLYEQVLRDGGVFIEERETIRDYKTGHAFNIQFYHPEFGYEDDLGGYTSIGFDNYLFPAHYPAREGRH